MFITRRAVEALREELSLSRQQTARAEGEARTLRDTVELLKSALGELAREEKNGALKARVAELEAQLQQCLVRATQPSSPVVAWPNGVPR